MTPAFMRLSPLQDCRSALKWGWPYSKFSFGEVYSDSFTIFGLWVLGLATSNINESPLQTNESKTLFLMTILPYYCIPGLAGTLWNITLCAKDTGCAGNKITGYIVGYTVANHDLRLHSYVAVKLNLRPYIQRYTTLNVNLEYSYPLSMHTR